MHDENTGIIIYNKSVFIPKPHTLGFTINKENVFIDNEFNGCARI